LHSAPDLPLLSAGVQMPQTGDLIYRCGLYCWLLVIDYTIFHHN
jgi:hypothetical protein